MTSTPWKEEQRTYQNKQQLNYAAETHRQTSAYNPLPRSFQISSFFLTPTSTIISMGSQNVNGTPPDGVVSYIPEAPVTVQRKPFLQPTDAVRLPHTGTLTDL
jgi:hypothetical protein